MVKYEPMNTRKHRHDGGAHQRFKTMVSYHAKPREESFLSAAEAIKKSEIIKI